MATRTCTTIRVQRSAIQLSGPVKREGHEQDLASVISTYTTSSWMAVCYCQPAYCLQLEMVVYQHTRKLIYLPATLIQTWHLPATIHLSR